jgi:hypothetical protein
VARPHAAAAPRSIRGHFVDQGAQQVARRDHAILGNAGLLRVRLELADGLGERLSQAGRIVMHRCLAQAGDGGEQRSGGGKDRIVVGPARVADDGGRIFDRGRGVAGGRGGGRGVRAVPSAAGRRHDERPVLGDFVFRIVVVHVGCLRDPDRAPRSAARGGRSWIGAIDAIRAVRDAAACGGQPPRIAQNSSSSPGNSPAMCIASPPDRSSWRHRSLSRSNSK